MQAQASIQISLTGDAFGEYPNEELARLLRKLAILVDVDQPTVAIGNQKPIIDTNGNTVGCFIIKSIRRRSPKWKPSNSH